MKLKAIKGTAYNRLKAGRKQVLDKNRGYGILCIKSHNLTFAIPLRSGLDYSKALVINDADLEPGSFKTRTQEEFQKIVRSKEKIVKEFSAYVAGYVDAVKSGKPLANDPRYKFTTLAHFHNELGL